MGPVHGAEVLYGGTGMKLIALCQKLWGSDFLEKPYGGYIHHQFHGIAGQISIALVFPAPFVEEDKAVAVQVNWSEIVPITDFKSLHLDDSLILETMRKSFVIKDGEIDEGEFVLFIKGVERQLSRNKWMLKMMN